MDTPIYLQDIRSSETHGVRKNEIAFVHVSRFCLTFGLNLLCRLGYVTGSRCYVTNLYPINPIRVIGNVIIDWPR